MGTMLSKNTCQFLQAPASDHLFVLVTTEDEALVVRATHLTKLRSMFLLPLQLGAFVASPPLLFLTRHLLSPQLAGCVVAFALFESPGFPVELLGAGAEIAMHIARDQTSSVYLPRHVHAVFASKAGLVISPL